MQIVIDQTPSYPAYSPERKLWKRVLEDAIQSALGSATALEPRDIQAARRWIDRKYTGLAPLSSFSWVCQELSLNEERIRAWVRQEVRLSRGGEKRLAHDKK